MSSMGEKHLAGEAIVTRGALFFTCFILTPGSFATSLKQLQRAAWFSVRISDRIVHLLCLVGSSKRELLRGTNCDSVAFPSPQNIRLVFFQVLKNSVNMLLTFCRSLISQT